MKKFMAALAVLIMCFALPINCYAAALPDGTYNPDFSFSGGTGRVKISCSSLTASGGKMTAVVVFSSSNYTYAKVGEEKYYNTNAGGNSTFNIPVSALDTDITVNAETTAMGDPHEIEYKFRFSVNVPNSDSSSTTSSSTPASTPTSAPTGTPTAAPTKAPTGSSSSSSSSNPGTADTTTPSVSAEVTQSQQSSQATPTVTQEVSPTTQAIEEPVAEKSEAEEAKQSNRNVWLVMAVIAIVVIASGAAVVIVKRKNKGR